MEVGGRLVVDGASFTVMPRDKVGLVGRNGAGKTSLFRVLGGERSSRRAGKIMRKGGFGYLPQDPRIAGVLDGRTAITHVLSGRGIDEELMRIEKLRIAMEEDAERAQRRPLQPGPGRVRHVRRLRRRERGPRDRRRARPAGPTGWICRSACSAVASAAASSSPASCSPAATCCCSTSRPTTSTSTPRCGCSQFLRDYRGALLVISHDLDLLDEAITRVLHLDRPAEDAVGAARRVQGHVHASTARRAPRDEERLAKKAVLQAKEIARLQTIVDRFGAKATKAAMAHSKEKHIARLEAAARPRPQGRPHAARALPRSAGAAASR